MKITIDRRERTPIYMQIRNQIILQITGGMLPSGSRLPAERTLAHDLGINRSTVVRAYEELAADGLVEARVGRGTTVCSGLPPAGASGAGPEFVSPSIGDAISATASSRNDSWHTALNRHRHRMQDDSLAAILNMLAGPDRLSFAGGVPDPSFYPLEEIRAASRDILERDWETALDYSATAGLPALRQRLSDYLASQGYTVPADQILICSGSQQGLDILARLLLEPGDSVVIEEPSYIGAINAFRMAEARLLTVPVDREGMRTDLLEDLLARQKPRCIYTMPGAHNPAACTMSLERRQHLTALARRYHIPVIEDDAYSSIYFGEAPPPLLASLDTEDLVIYLGSASKMLLPGLRIAWMAGAATLVNAGLLIKQITDLHSSSYSQLLIERLMDPRRLDLHLAKIRSLYRDKRDAMVEALDCWNVPGINWAVPEAGVYIWVELPKTLNTAQLLARTEARGVVFMPGAPFFPHGGGLNRMRLSFARHNPEEIKTGIQIIGEEMSNMLLDSGAVDKAHYSNSNLHLL